MFERASDETSTSIPPVSLNQVAQIDLQLLLPTTDEPDPEVSIVIPALNEELTIADFVHWCQEGLHRAGASGEIIIVDSSSDRTAELALIGGARVLKTPRRGLGRAYIDAEPYIRGKYVIMGDADCTYDFRELGAFVDALRNGHEFAMGSRWLGSIEPGSMPALHRYFGTPLTTWILNCLYGSHFTDIHCGMRGITSEAFRRMGLLSQSWEYASEMVLKSVRMELTTAEVPVKFYKDRDGRLSHHKRAGWTSPFGAAWINLRAMFIYGGDYFMLKPGLAMLTLGLLLNIPLSFGDIKIGSVVFSLYWMLIGLTLAVIGLQSFYFGCLAQVFSGYTDRSWRKWTRIFKYNRSMAVAFVLFLLGLVPLLRFVISYFSNNLTPPGASTVIDHMAVTGFMLMILSFSTFCFVLVLHATAVRYGIEPPNDARRRHHPRGIRVPDAGLRQTKGDHTVTQATEERA